VGFRKSLGLCGRAWDTAAETDLGGRMFILHYDFRTRAATANEPAAIE